MTYTTSFMFNQSGILNTSLAGYKISKQCLNMMIKNKSEVKHSSLEFLNIVLENDETNKSETNKFSEILQTRELALKYTT